MCVCVSVCQSRVPGTVIPLCAAQCERMFNSTRTPGAETGNTRTHTHTQLHGQLHTHKQLHTHFVAADGHNSLMFIRSNSSSSEQLTSSLI